MKLIIDIPDDWEKELNQSKIIFADVVDIDTIRNGIPLDKIRAEIADTLYVDSLIFGELIDFKNGKTSSDDVIEEFNRITRMEVLRIIDKYTAESEEA